MRLKRPAPKCPPRLSDTSGSRARSRPPPGSASPHRKLPFGPLPKARATTFWTLLPIRACQGRPSRESVTASAASWSWPGRGLFASSWCGSSTVSPVRQIVYAVTAANDLQEAHGVQLRSVTEPIDTATPMGRTVFAILAGMAEQERQVITERTFLGRREKASRGGFAGGAAPLGYKKDRQGGLVEDGESAATVRRIFAMRAKGATLQAIANSLNTGGVPTAREGKWWPATVRYVLDNPKYRGQVEYLFRWSGAETHIVRPGAHPHIVKASRPSSRIKGS